MGTPLPLPSHQAVNPDPLDGSTLLRIADSGTPGTNLNGYLQNEGYGVPLLASHRSRWMRDAGFSLIISTGRTTRLRSPFVLLRTMCSPSRPTFNIKMLSPSSPACTFLLAHHLHSSQRLEQSHSFLFEAQPTSFLFLVFFGSLSAWCISFLSGQRSPRTTFDSCHS